MTSSAAEMGNSGLESGQMQGSTSKQTVDTEDRSVSIGQYNLPGKAEHAQHDNGNIGEPTITDKPLNEGARSEAASQAAEQPSLHAEQQASAVQKSDMQAEPVSVTGNGWSAHMPGRAPDIKVRESGSTGVAAEEAVKGAGSVSAEPVSVAADADSAGAPKRPRPSAKQRRMVLRQHAEMVRQIQALLAILLRQIKLAGEDPLAEEELEQQQAEVVATVFAPEQTQGAGSGATAQPIVSPVYAVPAITHKPGKLTPEAESKLLIHFGLQDTLTREETQALAAQVGASEAAVRDHIGKLRGNMRAALQRLQRKVTSGSPPSAPPRAHAHHAVPGMQAGAVHAPRQQPTALVGRSEPQSDNAASLGATHAAPIKEPTSAHPQQAGAACRSPTAIAPAQEKPPAQGTVQAQHTQAVPSPSWAAGSGPPKALDLSGLKAILINAGLSQAAKAVQMDAARPSASAAAAVPQPGQVPQPSLSSITHSSGPGSSAAAPASGAALQAAVMPPPQKASAAGPGLSATSPGAGAAALAAVDKACAEDTAMLSSMLDPQRSIRKDCTGKLAGALLGMKTAEGRHETLLAMLRTSPAASLMPVALSQRCLETLAEWTRWGMLDRQTTILRLLLGVLLRLTIPPTMLHTGTLLRAVSSMQSYKVPSVANGATNLLHHWQQQEPSLWPSAPRKQPGPSPFVAPAANSHTQKYREQPAAQPGRGQPAAHGVGPSTNGSGVNHSSTATKQQPAAPSKAFYRGVAGRMGAQQPAKSANTKPLTADEIVQSQLRKRQAASALTKGASGKVPRLDNKSMLEAAAKRRPGPARHGAMGNGPSSLPMGLQHSRQSPAQAQHLQFSPAPQAPGAALLAPGSLSAPSAATLQALLRAAQGIDRVNSADPRQKGGMAAQQPTKGGHGSALEPRLTVDWCQPPVIDVQYEPDLELGQGAGSRELHTQQMLRASQLEVVYVLPELIPATPGEPRHATEEQSHALQSIAPRVPLLPTDPDEARASYQWLHSLQLPQEAIVGRLAVK